jgi:hypothetical protein
VGKATLMSDHCGENPRKTERVEPRRLLNKQRYYIYHSSTLASGIFIDMYEMEPREVIHNLAAYLAHHHGTWVYTYFSAEDVELAKTCYWHEESQSMRYNKEQMWDNIMNWYTEFQVQIENMENMGNLDAAPPGAAAQNLVGSVDSMYFMDRHASAVFNNTRSMDASLKPPTSTSKLPPI